MILTCGSEKGGTGKTTTVVNLAVMLALAGRETILVDADRMASATQWLAARAGPVPQLTCVRLHGQIGRELVNLSRKYEFVLVDVAGADGVELRQALTVADLTIALTRPSQVDAWSIETMAQLVRDIRLRTDQLPKVRVLLNAVPANPRSREAADIRQHLAQDDYPVVLPPLFSQLTDRAAFRHSARTGQGVVELRHGSAAAATREMTDLYKEVFDVPFTPIHAA